MPGRCAVAGRPGGGPRHRPRLLDVRHREKGAPTPRSWREAVPCAAPSSCSTSGSHGRSCTTPAWSPASTPSPTSAESSIDRWLRSTVIIAKRLGVPRCPRLVHLLRACSRPAVVHVYSAIHRGRYARRSSAGSSYLPHSADADHQRPRTTASTSVVAAPGPGYIVHGGIADGSKESKPGHAQRRTTCRSSPAVVQDHRREGAQRR